MNIPEKFILLSFLQRIFLICVAKERKSDLKERKLVGELKPFTKNKKNKCVRNGKSVAQELEVNPGHSKP